MRTVRGNVHVHSGNIGHLFVCLHKLMKGTLNL